MEAAEWNSESKQVCFFVKFTIFEKDCMKLLFDLKTVSASEYCRVGIILAATETCWLFVSGTECFMYAFTLRILDFYTIIRKIHSL